MKYTKLGVLLLGLCVTGPVMANGTVKVVNKLSSDGIEWDFYPEGEDTIGIWISPGSSSEKSTDALDHALDNIKIRRMSADGKTVIDSFNYTIPSDKKGMWIFEVRADGIDGFHSEKRINTTYLNWPK